MPGSYRDFISKEDGVTTVEAVIWFPIYILIIGIVFDTTMLLIGQTEMWSVAGDSSRAVALGRMDENEAVEWIEDTVGADRGFTATVTTNGDLVTTEISRPFRSVPSLGIITSLSAALVAEANYRLEPAT